MKTIDCELNLNLILEPDMVFQIKNWANEHNCTLPDAYSDILESKLLKWIDFYNEPNLNIIKDHIIKQYQLFGFRKINLIKKLLDSFDKSQLLFMLSDPLCIPWAILENPKFYFY